MIAKNEDAFSSCIETCQQCHNICLQTALTHCLKMGGQHTAEEHFRLMMNCAEICQVAANFMLSQSSLHHAICSACAKVCEACAKSCEPILDMQECALVCRKCADSCAEMAKNAA